MTTEFEKPTGAIGAPVKRVDGRAKVTGQATYSAEWALDGLCHAVVVEAHAGPGTLTSLDTRAAEAAPGVIAVLSHRNARPPGPVPGQAPMSKSGGDDDEQESGPKPVPDPGMMFRDAEVTYAGQPVALVVAETLEAAREAARLIKPRIQTRRPELSLEAHLGVAYAPEKVQDEPATIERGDLARGLGAADQTVDAVYVTTAESHNPMEPHATTAHYKDGKLAIYDATQFVFGVKRLVAQVLAMSPKDIRVVCRYVGGGFGSKGLPWPHVILAALATRHVGRPVRLAVERRQMFGFVGFRPRTHQHMRLGARADGSLTAIAHHVTSQTSQHGEFVEPSAKATSMLYSCPNVSVAHRLVRLDTQTPTFQRAPGEASGSLALECALDELAYALEMDPLALRLKNYAEHDESKNRPWSSRELRACYQRGAERFGWADRPMAPRSIRRGNWLIGYGMATATYPCNRSGATAKVRFGADGRTLVQTASHDLGTGAYTIFTQVAAQALGVPIASVTVELGDTDFPFAPVAGGSQSSASVSVPLHQAAVGVKRQLAALAVKNPNSPFYGDRPEDLDARDGRLVHRAHPDRSEPMDQVLKRAGLPHLELERTAKPGEEVDEYASHAWGAQFAEVAVDASLGMVRVTRMVGAFAGGTILNERTAKSQLMGGMVMGVGMALLEEVTRDPRQARVVNGNLADYLVPVNADIPDLDVILVPEVDTLVNPLGIKGLGELGIVGSGAAVANAVYHATGKRIREFPIKIEHLL